MVTFGLQSVIPVRMVKNSLFVNLADMSLKIKIEGVFMNY